MIYNTAGFGFDLVFRRFVYVRELKKCTFFVRSVRWRCGMRNDDGAECTATVFEIKFTTITVRFKENNLYLTCCEQWCLIHARRYPLPFGWLSRDRLQKMTKRTCNPHEISPEKKKIEEENENKQKNVRRLKRVKTKGWKICTTRGSGGGFTRKGCALRNWRRRCRFGGIRRETRSPTTLQCSHRRSRQRMPTAEVPLLFERYLVGICIVEIGNNIAVDVTEIKKNIYKQ